MSLKQLFASLEDLDVNDTAPVISADDTLEQEIFDVSDAAGEVESNGDDVDQLEEIQDGLESICVSLEAAVADGGLDPKAALYMHHAVGAYTRRLGLEGTSVVASLESFGGTSSRAGSTTISLESVKETIKKVWQAIKNGVAKAIEAIKNFFAKIFTSVDKLQDRAASIIKRAKAVGGTTIEGKIKLTGASQLAYNGKTDTKSVISGLSATLELIQDGWSDLANGADKYYEQWGALLGSGATQKAMDEAAIEKAVREADESFTVIAAKVTARTKEISGGYYLTASGAGSAAGGSEEDNTKTTVTVGRKKPSVNETVEVEASLRDAEEIATIVDSILENIKARKGYMEKLNKARDSAIKKVDSFVDTAEKSALGKGWTQAKVRLGMRKATKDLTRPLASITSNSFNVSRSALAFADRIVSAGEGAGKKKDTKDKDAKK